MLHHDLVNNGLCQAFIIEVAIAGPSAVALSLLGVGGLGSKYSVLWTLMIAFTMFMQL